MTTNKYVKEVDIVNLLYQKFEILYDRLNQRTSLKDNQIKLWNQTYTLGIKLGRFKYEINDDILTVFSKESDVSKIRKNDLQKRND